MECRHLEDNRFIIHSLFLRFLQGKWGKNRHLVDHFTIHFKDINHQIINHKDISLDINHHLPYISLEVFHHQQLSVLETQDHLHLVLASDRHHHNNCLLPLTNQWLSMPLLSFQVVIFLKRMSSVLTLIFLILCRLKSHLYQIHLDWL